MTIARILSVLKEDGVLVIRVPYREDLSAYASPECPYKYVHVRNFDENSLRLLFEKVFQCELIEINEAGYILDFKRLRHRDLFTEDECTALASWLPKVERISPSLYWDILRKSHLSVEISAAIKKRIPPSRKSSSCPIERAIPDRKWEILYKGTGGDDVSPSERNALEALEKKLAVERQKNAFLEARLVEARDGIGVISERDALIVERDSLQAERDSLSDERDTLLAQLNSLHAKLRKLGLLWFFRRMQ
jgi:hypothetical protein